MTLTVATPADLLGLPGTPLGPTPWMDIDAERIARFAAATGDLPVDEPLGQEYLTLSLVNLFLPQLLTVETFSMGINVGLDRVRFPSPVRVGDSIRGRGEVSEIVMTRCSRWVPSVSSARRRTSPDAARVS